VNSRALLFGLFLIASDTSQKLRSALEFGVVIAVVMLLMAFAMQSYETSTIRAQISEAFSLTAGTRAEMIIYRAHHGQWPESKADLQNSTLSEEYALGTYVDHLELHDGGSLSAIFDNESSASSIVGRQLTLRPMTVSSSPGSPIVWACAGYSASEDMAPDGPDKTDIDATHLPSICRDY